MEFPAVAAEGEGVSKDVDFSDHPPTIGELRADRTEDASD